MCGIIGALDLRGRRIFDPLRLARMAASVAHRGPDDARAWSEPGLAMATQRLAVSDPAGGRQPLRDPSGRVVVACNGELYDAAALRGELAARGHAIDVRCDTALWPGLYLEHGQGLFERARGQFAVALWDRQARVLLLGRDRLGICPLYLARGDGWLLWASEIKALLASGLVEVEADLAGVDHVFSMFAAGTKRTCFRGVESVWPGHLVRVDGAGEVTRRRYWDIAFTGADAPRSARDLEGLIEEATARLSRAVARRLEADAPVATCLSSGLDSTLMAALARRARGGALDAFTVGYEGAGRDERPSARRSAAALGLRLHEVVPTAADLLEALPRAVEAAEGPIMDMANVSMLLLAEGVAARGFKVLLTGEGADELFGGYVWNKVAAWLRPAVARLPGAAGALRRALGWLVAPGTPSPRLRARFGDAAPAVLALYEPLWRAARLYYSEAMAAAVADHDPFDALDVDVARMRGWRPLERSLYVELKLMLPGHLLVGKGDRVTMRSGVESRYPFLDEEVVALASGVAPALKVRGRREKWLLRQVARRVLPAQIPDPPKTMFKARSLCELEPRPRWVEQLLSEASLRATGLFSAARVRGEERLQRTLPSWSPRRYVADASYTVVVTTQLWQHLFFGGGLCELTAWSPPTVVEPLPMAGAEVAMMRR